MSKNLTFKLIMDADSKGFVSGVKQSESVAKSVFEAIKTESDKLRQSSAEAAKEIGNIIPKGTSELAAGLTKSLSSATEIIKDAGENAKSTAGNFTDFGNKSHKALDLLKADLTSAKQKLQEFSNSNASPADIEVAQRQVDQLEKEVQQADQAFNDFQAEVGRANTQLKETDSAAASAKKGLDGAKFAVNALVGAMAALGVGLGLRELAEAADAYTGLSARIQIATKDGGNFESAMAGVHQVALATNSSLQATGDLFTRIDAVGKEMGMTQQQALDLTKTVTQAIQIGGGSAQASEAAITQFIQAMQGGVLRGEEFNSIMENGYGLAEALAKGLGVTTGELRKMAENGELTSERVAKALQSQAAQVQSTYDQFPTTIGNALTKIATQWQILIGTMDQANGASATVAEWLVVIADNMDVVETILKDVGEGFIWVGDQLKKIDPATIEALKEALSTAYETIKSMASSFGNGIGIAVDQLNTLLGAIFNFESGVDTATDKTNGFTKALQSLNVVFGFIGDGFDAISIVANLLAGVFYDVAAAWINFKSKFTWGDTKQQLISEMNEMAQKAQDWYNKASNGATDFKSKGIAAIEEISKTQTEKDAESVASSKAKLEKLLADQTAEADGRKATEQEKLKAVQDYAEAAIKANGGAMDGTMQADLMTKGYIVTMNEAGKVSVEAWDVAAEGAERNANMADKARKAATALGLDLDVSLNRVSAKFKESEGQLNNFTAGLEDLGVTGEKAGSVTYEAWLKWLETAKSQAEIDMAKAKLEQFGEQGKLSTSQVEQGLIAVKHQAQGLPGDIDPVTAAFKRLGIETKENLKLSAQQALMDYITIRDSGKASAEGIQKAYEKAAQAAALSGDQAVIASANAAGAGRDLRVEIDETGKASVKAMDDLTEANHRVRESARRIGDGYREAGQIAREEANAAQIAWNKASQEAAQKWDAEMKRQSKGLSAAISGYQSMSKNDVISQIKSMGYSEDQAKKLAGSIWSQAMETDRDAKFAAYGKGGNLAMNKLIEQEFNNAAAKGLTTQHGTNKINELLRNLDVRTTGSTPKVNDYAPDISEPKIRDLQNDAPTKNVRFEFVSGGKRSEMQGSQEDGDTMESILREFEMLKKAM
ncbi:tape measure protein [Acinetobacter sp. Lyrl_1]|uniref:tape measure protein n=1 Tax=Acinetobacter sp. Lyrl_1 TaxID=3110920 RepID=UPI003F7B9E20